MPSALHLAHSYPSKNLYEKLGAEADLMIEIQRSQAVFLLFVRKEKQGHRVEFCVLTFENIFIVACYVQKCRTNSRHVSLCPWWPDGETLNPLFLGLRRVIKDTMDLGGKETLRCLHRAT